MGFKLLERLTVYPRFINKRSEYLDPGLRERILAMARHDGFAHEQILEAI